MLLSAFDWFVDSIFAKHQYNKKKVKEKKEKIFIT
jgi:hypothetical protein